MFPTGALPKPTGDRKVLVLVEALKCFAGCWGRYFHFDELKLFCSMLRKIKTFSPEAFSGGSLASHWAAFSPKKLAIRKFSSTAIEISKPIAAESKDGRYSSQQHNKYKYNQDFKKKFHTTMKQLNYERKSNQQDNKHHFIPGSTRRQH